MKALALLSGGLDSILAVKMIQEQVIEVEALNFTSIFCTCTSKSSSCSAARAAVDQLGIPLISVEKSNDMIAAVKNPAHGHGSGMNPCLDCRIFIFKRAKKLLPEIGASFIISGEVLGERPMSQRRQAMELIEKKAGVEGLVVRPLCAKHMPPSIAEQKGWVDREKLMDIRGRSRKPQIALAESLNITDYPCPAGGCRLTEPGYAARMRDLMKHQPDFDVNDAQLLKYGRHFRLSSGAKAVIGRNKDENDFIAALKRDGDIIMMPVDIPGPLALVRGGVGEDELTTAAALAARYCGKDAEGDIRIKVESTDAEYLIIASSRLDEEEIELMRIGRLSVSALCGGH